MLLGAAALLAYLLILAVLFQAALKRCPLQGNQMVRRWRNGRFPRGLVWLAFACVFTALLFSATSCCENDRFFVQVTPYLIPIAVYLIAQAVSGFRGSLGWLRNKYGDWAAPPSP
jgi:hypothetical protein